MKRLKNYLIVVGFFATFGCLSASNLSSDTLNLSTLILSKRDSNTQDLYSLPSGPEKIQAARNLQKESALAVSSGKPYVLYVSRKDCPDCKRLEKDVLIPLIHSGQYDLLISLRELPWDSGSITGFKGQLQSADRLIEHYKVIGTPTLLFLDANGVEIAQQVPGYQSEDFYWYYLDKAIELARIILRKETSN